MILEIFATLLLLVTAFAADEWRNHRRTKRELGKANADLSARLATVTGQLADERARLALRVHRAHEGACKAAAKRKALRINIDQQRTAVQDLPAKDQP